MEKHSYKIINLDVYEEVLDNGLRIYISKIPRNSIHARITTFFGGSILEFKSNGKGYKMPAGVAHFLEHKMFENKDGVDPLAVYENNGASANAFTNEFVTAYHFTGASHFEENLNTLLTCVHSPYFTDENVLKEKGIISQEKKQDLDNPFSIVYDRALETTFYNLDFKNTVLGSLEDINSITKEDLYNCYNTFYHPSNMILTISGDVDVDKTLNLIKSFYSKLKFPKRSEIEIVKKGEPEEVVSEKEVIFKKGHKSNTMIINYKIKNNHFIKDDYLNRIYLSLLLEMKFGAISKIVDILSHNKDVLSPLSSYMQAVDDYFILSFSIISNDEGVINLIDDTLKDKTFSEEDFDLIKKVTLNNILLSTENATGVCSLISNQVYFFNNPVYDMYEKLKNLDFETFKNYVDNLNLDNRSVVMLKGHD